MLSAKKYDPKCILYSDPTRIFYMNNPCGFYRNVLNDYLMCRVYMKANTWEGSTQGKMSIQFCIAHWNHIRIMRSLNCNMCTLWLQITWVSCPHISIGTCVICNARAITSVGFHVSLYDSHSVHSWQFYSLLIYILHEQVYIFIYIYTSIAGSFKGLGCCYHSETKIIMIYPTQNKTFKRNVNVKVMFRERKLYGHIFPTN